jgi:hypothetical protein
MVTQHQLHMLAAEPGAEDTVIDIQSRVKNLAENIKIIKIK